MRVSRLPWGSGKVSRIVDTFDWSRTPLGPQSAWPISLKTIVESCLNSSFPQAVVWGPDRTTIHNDAFLPILGGKPSAIGRSFADVWAEAWDKIGPMADSAYAGESTFIENYPLVINRSGYDEQAYFTFCYSPLRDDEGKFAGMLDTVVETTETVRAKEMEEILRRELLHRVKNTMAVTNAVVSASIRNSTTLEQARETISRRLDALGKAQNLISASDEGAEIGQVIADALAPHLDHPDRAILSGPSAQLSPEQVVGLSLAIYELATNASKYGALSNESGRIRIEWERSGEDRFTFLWRERGGPVVSEPSRTGFGSRLTNKIVASYFDGKAETEYAPEGVTFRLSGSFRAQPAAEQQNPA